MSGFPSKEEAQKIAEQTLDDYGKYVNDGMARLYRFMGLDGIEWENSGAVVKDVYGKEYIDCAGYGVFIHGHRHPKVVEAVKKQLDRVALSNRTLPSKPVTELARLLAEVTPGRLQYSFFCNSGTEAMEGALKLARVYSGRKEFVSTLGGFHGKSFGALSASGRELYREPFYPLVPGFKHVPFGDLKAMEEAVDKETAAVVLEPIQGEGGVLLPPDNYLQGVRDICDAQGALLIMDEVQTGLGRTGKLFACQHWGVEPDIMCLSKALGGGVVPIGAVVATPEVFEPYNTNPYLHSSTFGGNPLACAAGYAALKALLEDGLLERAAELGDYMMDRLLSLKDQYPRVIAAVRGKGLLVGVEFVNDGAGGCMISNLLDLGVIVLHSLNNHKVIRIMPPAVISDGQLNKALEAFAESVDLVDQVIEQL